MYYKYACTYMWQFTGVSPNPESSCFLLQILKTDSPWSFDGQTIFAMGPWGHGAMGP